MRRIPPKKEILRLRKFFATGNLEAARTILEHPERNGGEGSYAVRWAKEQLAEDDSGRGNQTVSR